MAILPRIKKLNRDDETDTMNEKQIKKKKLFQIKEKTARKRSRKPTLGKIMLQQ